MALYLAIVLLLFLGHTPIGWFGGIFLVGIWLGKKEG